MKIPTEKELLIANEFHKATDQRALGILRSLWLPMNKENAQLVTKHLLKYSSEIIMLLESEGTNERPS